ncbi:lysophospholipid acyltransferase family protein [Mesorhizobium sp. KR2-14]|uniref:lysophospholipid acyltransferase family protein n=1 Tax=Mesorhizobium sp. KR2-14 TaxID=3156610 RepID=UPI0032B4CECB
MEDQAVAPVARVAAGKKRKAGVVQSFWRKVRKPLAQSRFVKGAIGSFLAYALRFVRLTNPLAKGSSNLREAQAELSPAIIALWHGQHLLAPCLLPRGQKMLAMVSRSADAELNALALEKLGFEAVRGSGGREDVRHLDKGGARALIALKKALDAGTNVAMIADIPHGTPREAGLGIVTLARLSGRPVVPLAVATSRRKVLERTWDKTTINLPFGRSAAIVGEPLHVPADADAAEMERKRQELTASLTRATEEAYSIVDGGRT